MSETTAFKDTLFEPEAIRSFASAVHSEHNRFDPDSFERSVFEAEWADVDWADLELMDRMRHVTRSLSEHLPADYPEALEILLRLVQHEDEIGGFLGMVPCDFVATYGLDHPDRSIPALARLTILASAEFAVRPYLLRYQDETLRQMLLWSGNDDVRVRRLASEGCRPRLPWGIGLPALKADPRPLVPILDELKDDESEDVRRSVANNLNDISKDNPEVVLDVLNRWQANDPNCFRDFRERALRSLVKAGNPEALELLGFPRDPLIEVLNVRVEPSTIKMGDKAELTFEVVSLSQSDQNLMIDFVVHYVKANGKTSPKVWKLAKRRIGPAETLDIRKRLSFQKVSTRRHYPGTHSVQPKINGKLYDLVEFEVEGTETPDRE